MNRLFKKTVKVTAWREEIPGDPAQYNPKKLVGTQLEITDLRVKFQVERSLPKKRSKSPPATCEIYISNLSENTRANLETKPLKIQLAAGYDDAPRLLFMGDLEFGMSKQDGPNWETLLQVKDGSRAYNHSRISNSYNPGTTVRTILRDAAKSMGMELPRNLASDSSLDAQYVNGRQFTGPARGALTKLLAPYGYGWAIHNGTLRILRDEDTSTTLPLLIDEEHGMIGTPEFGSPPRSGKPPHVTVKMLLYPEIGAGDLVQVKSRAVNGLYRVERAVHQGDTHADEWVSELEIKPTSK